MASLGLQSSRVVPLSRREPQCQFHACSHFDCLDFAVTVHFKMKKLLPVPHADSCPECYGILLNRAWLTTPLSVAPV